jgi:hypothetical protein
MHRLNIVLPQIKNNNGTAGKREEENLQKVPGQVGPGGTQLKTTTTSLQKLH